MAKWAGLFTQSKMKACRSMKIKSIKGLEEMCILKLNLYEYVPA